MPVAHVLAEGQGQMGWKPPGPRAITAQQSLSGSDVENWREVGGAALHPTAGPAGPGSPSKLHSALWSGPDPVAGDTEAEAWEPCLTRAPGPALPAAQPRAQSVGAQRPSLPASCIRGPAPPGVRSQGLRAPTTWAPRTECSPQSDARTPLQLWLHCRPPPSACPEPQGLG